MTARIMVATRGQVGAVAPKFGQKTTLQKNEDTLKSIKLSNGKVSEKQLRTKNFRTPF